MNHFIHFISSSWLNRHSLLLHRSLVYTSLMDKSESTLENPCLCGVILKKDRLNYQIRIIQTLRAYQYCFLLEVSIPLIFAKPRVNRVIIDTPDLLTGFFNTFWEKCTETRASAPKIFHRPIVGVCVAHQLSRLSIVSFKLFLIRKIKLKPFHTCSLHTCSSCSIVLRYLGSSLTGGEQDNLAARSKVKR